MEKEIKVGIGLGNVRFGSSKAAIKKIIGEPNEIDHVDVPIDEEEIAIEQWHYDELELSLSFNDFDNELLDTFAVSSPEYTLNGKQLIGKSIIEINHILDDLNLGECIKEDLSDDDDDENTHVYSFQDANMNFWFEDDELSEIQWGPDENFEQPLIFAN